MVECINEYFIKDNEILSVDQFTSNISSIGTSIYEVIRVIDGIPLFLELHLERLFKSATLKGIFIDATANKIEDKINLLIKRNKVIIGNVKIIFNYTSEASNFYAFYISHNYPSLEQYKNGVETILYFGERKNPNAKVINNDFRLQVESKIKEHNAFEAILVNNNGCITEGSKSNIFLIKGEEIHTALAKDVLKGITRDKIIEACYSCNYKVVEKDIHYTELSEYDALFISGTSPKALPISKVDNISYSSALNTVMQNIMLQYDIIINNYVKSKK